MQRILVKDFGPLVSVDLEIKEFMVFIGPNASGKSTLAKILHFYNCFPTRISDNLRDSFGDIDFEYNLMLYECSLMFAEQGFPNKTEYTSLEFYFSNDLSVIFDFSISIGETAPLPRFSPALVELTKNLFELKAFFENKLADEETKNGFRSNNFLNVKSSFQIEIDRIIDANFDNLGSSSKVFIPEARNDLDYLGGVLGDQIQSTIFYLQAYFKEASKFPSSLIEILKGLPVEISKNKFGIKLKNGEVINFGTLSSGQRNAFWLVMILFQKSLMDSNYNHLIIEEPETHLFPDSQKILAELISTIANKKKNKVVVTTHSHYILGTLNVLLNAHRIGQTSEDQVNKIIDKSLWIDNHNFFAGYIENGIVKDIYNNEAEMLEIEDLNKIAGELNDKFNDLLEIEFENAN